MIQLKGYVEVTSAAFGFQTMAIFFTSVIRHFFFFLNLDRNYQVSKMAEVIGTLASAIAIAQLTYASNQTLYNTISGMWQAHKTLEDLQTEVNNLKQVIGSFQRLLETQECDQSNSNQFSPGQIDNIKAVQPSLEVCSAICDEFCAKLDTIAKTLLKIGNTLALPADSW